MGEVYRARHKTLDREVAIGSRTRRPTEGDVWIAMLK